MQISSRFTVALHIFTCVDTFKDDYKVTSDFLASSINTNPVIIRKILSQLKNADARLSSMLRHRGIKYSVWTASSAKDSETFYSLEYPEFTGNYPHQSDKYARSLKIAEGADGRITVTLTHYDRTDKDVTALAEFVPLSGSVTYKDGKVSGSGTYAFRLKTGLLIVTDYEYFVYSTAKAR